jgi:hypothetical protein
MPYNEGSASPERRICALDARDAMSQQNGNLELAATAQEGIQNCMGTIRNREQFASLFALERHTERRKPAHGRLFIKGRQNIADDRLRSIKILGMNFVVCHVTAPAAGDENLRADFFGGIQQDDV